MNYPNKLLFFGSFNPPHLGHSYLLNRLLINLPSIENIFVIPSYKSVWQKNLLPFQDRYQMCQLAFLPLDQRIKILDTENSTHLSGYTLDTIKYLNLKNAGLALGSDSLTTFDKWQDYQEILKLVNLYVVPRDHHSHTQIKSQLSPTLLSFLNQKIFLLPSPQPDPIEATYSSSTYNQDPKKYSYYLDLKVLTFLNLIS